MGWGGMGGVDGNGVEWEVSGLNVMGWGGIG